MNAVAWLRYGIDLPYLDDWRTYRNGTAYSLSLRHLFTPANDTLFPVGRFLDVLAMRYLAGNSVAYQLLSMIAVLGGLLALQWRLLVLVLKDRVLAASCFSLTVFMLQPDTYWGLQNLAYHQAVPLLCILGSLLVVLRFDPRSFIYIPLLLALGFISGLTYISGAFAILILAGVLLIFALFSPASARSYWTSGLTLFVAGAICTAAQLWVILSAQRGEISAHVAWAMPSEVGFWAFTMGKVGRALLLPTNSNVWSLIATTVVILLTVGLCLWFLLRLFKNRFVTSTESSGALVFLALTAVVFVYLMLVAAGRTNLRPDTVTDFLDIFTFGFLRFHFFWVTVLWPWLAAAVFLVAGRNQFNGNRTVLLLAFLMPVFVVLASTLAGAFDHASIYKAKMAYRMEHEVKCLEDELREGGAIICPAMVGFDRDMSDVLEFARRHGASFTRYFSDARSNGVGALMRPLAEGPVLSSPSPGGEITKGTIIEQIVTADESEVQAVASDETVCLRLFLGTFDRLNKGHAQVTLQAADWVRTFDLEFGSVLDNSFHELCSAARLQQGSSTNNMRLLIQGAKGQPSQSITAWLSEDTSRGIAKINGSLTGRSLVFTIAPEDPFRLGGLLSSFAYGAYALVLAAAFAVLMQARSKIPVNESPIKHAAGCLDGQTDHVTV